MRITRRLVSLSLLFYLLCFTAQAQTTAFGEFSTAIINGGTTLAVTVRLRADPTIDLGSSNVAFTFNTAALLFPLNPVKGTFNASPCDADYCYHRYDGTNGTIIYNSTVTVSGLNQNRISINIGLNSINNGASLPTTFVDVVTINLTITDPAASTQLVWDPGLEVLNEDFVEVDLYAFDDNNVLLPVELTSFEARADGNAVLLHWETASETNNAGFQVQHEEATLWEAVAFVEGQGTTLERKAYDYKITGLLPGLHRFRLKQVDYDGTFAYSPEVEIAIGVPGTFHLSPAYPNPFNPMTTFSLSVARSQRVQVAVYDVWGRLVSLLHEGFFPQETAKVLRFEAGTLPSGMYLIQVSGESFRTAQSVMLVK